MGGSGGRGGGARRTAPTPSRTTQSPVTDLSRGPSSQFGEVIESKVDAPPDLLKPISMGKSSVLKVGQQCLAIGNPFGFDHTLTVGVISGLNREIFSQTGVTIGGGIQTDAAINPGNSGGPLLDSKGNLQW